MCLDKRILRRSRFCSLCRREGEGNETKSDTDAGDIAVIQPRYRHYCWDDMYHVGLLMKVPFNSCGEFLYHFFLRLAELKLIFHVMMKVQRGYIMQLLAFIVCLHSSISVRNIQPFFLPINLHKERDHSDRKFSMSSPLSSPELPRRNFKLLKSFVRTVNNWSEPLTQVSPYSNMLRVFLWSLWLKQWRSIEKIEWSCWRGDNVSKNLQMKFNIKKID